MKNAILKTGNPFCPRLLGIPLYAIGYNLPDTVSVEILALSFGFEVEGAVVLGHLRSWNGWGRVWGFKF